ncbi:MAG: alpha/beta hydrolase [Syntrophomonadaceae bacterium]|nr:alpha/beta hydrolase [Syntrophomonadaceae bacterium]
MEKSWIISSTGLRLAVLKNIPATEISHILIACHGFRGGKENAGKITLLAEKLSQIGIGLVAFDFEGSGESEGEFSRLTISKQAQNLKDVIRSVYKEYKLPIILLGRSLGGTTVLAGGTDEDVVAAYILWSTPVQLRETFSKIMGDAYNQMENGNGLLIRDENGAFRLEPDFIQDFSNHNMNKYFEQIGNRPVLVIHGQSDEIVKPINATGIAQAVKHASINIIEGADHRFSGQEEHRMDLTVQWLKENI